MLAILWTMGMMKRNIKEDFMQDYSDAKEKVIFSKRLRIELRRRGFEPFMELPHLSHPGWMCWYYDNTPEFQEALSELMGSQKERSPHE